MPGHWFPRGELRRIELAVQRQVFHPRRRTSQIPAGIAKIEVQLAVRAKHKGMHRMIVIRLFRIAGEPSYSIL